MSQGTRGGEGGPGEPEEGQQEGQEEGQEEGQVKARRRQVIEGGPQPSLAKLKICNPILLKTFKSVDIICNVDV